MAAELWEQLGNTTSVEAAGWPKWDDKLIVSDTMTVIVQVNGKLRAKLTLSVDTNEEDVKKQALSEENVQKFLSGKEPSKVIYVRGKIVNIVV